MRFHIYAVVGLILSISAAADVDIFQNMVSVNATQAIDPGPKGIGGLLTQINTSVGPGVELTLSGTWFQRSDTIIVDALITQNDDPVSGANCTISLKDSTFTEILSSAPMPEQAINGEPHYVYNATNISAIAGSVQTGKFFGHVLCIKSPPKPFTVFKETDFEVHDIENNTGLINNILETRTFLERLLERQFDFSQEEVFLITDSFTATNNLLKKYQSGDITTEEAQETLDSIEKNLHHYKSQTISLKSSSAEKPEQVIAKVKPISVKRALYAFIIGFLLGSIGIVLWRRHTRIEEFG